MKKGEKEIFKPCFLRFKNIYWICTKHKILLCKFLVNTKYCVYNININTAIDYKFYANSNILRRLYDDYKDQKEKRGNS